MAQSAKEYLKRLQDSEKTHLRYPWELHHWEELKGSRKDILGGDGNISTPEKQEMIDQINAFDEDNYLEEAKNYLLQYVRPEEQKILSNIPIGFVRSYTPTAWTVCSPSDTSVIILNIGLLGFSDDLARLYIAYLKTFLGLGNGYEKYSIRELHKKFTYSALHFTTDGHFHNRDYHINLYSDNDLYILYYLGQDIIHFVLAHELAHTALGHVGRKKQYVSDIYLNDDPIKVMLYRWKEEFEADIWALDLLLAYSKPDDLQYKFTFLAPILFLSGIDYLTGILNFSKEDGLDSDLENTTRAHFLSDHPPAINRRNYLMNTIGPDATPIERAYMLYIRDMFEKFMEIFESVSK